MVRSIVQEVFRAFCPFLDVESLNILLSVITDQDDEEEVGEQEMGESSGSGSKHSHSDESDDDRDDGSDDSDESDDESSEEEKPPSKKNKTATMQVEDDDDENENEDDDEDEESLDDEQMFAMDQSITNMLRVMKEEKKSKKGTTKLLFILNSQLYKLAASISASAFCPSFPSFSNPNRIAHSYYISSRHCSKCLTEITLLRQLPLW